MRKKPKIESATSMRNGIRFYSLSRKNYMSVATLDDSGVIKTKWTTEEEYKASGPMSTIKKVLIVIGLICLFPLSKWLDQISYLTVLRICLLSSSIISSICLVAKLINPKNIEMYKFHAAEHMTLNAFFDLDRLPTLEEVRNYSRFTNTCGSTELAILINTFPLYFACTYIPNTYLMLLCSFLIFILSNFGKEHGWFNWIQKFNTIPPDDIHIKVAIAGLKTLIRNEKKN